MNSTDVIRITRELCLPLNTTRTGRTHGRVHDNTLAFDPLGAKVAARETFRHSVGRKSCPMGLTVRGRVPIGGLSEYATRLGPLPKITVGDVI